MLNSIKKQFKTFFSKTYSKPFVVICLVVIIFGAIHALYVVSVLKQDIDVKIAQREVELNKIYDTEDQKSDATYQALNEKYKTCISEYRSEHPGLDSSSYIPSFLTGCGSEPFHFDSFGGYQMRYLGDASYKELTRIKKTSSFQLFFEKLSFGWWGVIALVLVFSINLIFVIARATRIWATALFKYGFINAGSIKNNLNEMTPFQRYSLILFVIIALALVVIIITFVF